MRPGTARGKPIASNWSQAIVPLVSVRSSWSTAMPISSPASALPATRWLSISLRVRLLGLLDRGGAGAAPPPDPPTALGSTISALVHGDEGAAAGADVVAARSDEPVVVVLLDDGRRARPRRSPSACA